MHYKGASFMGYQGYNMHYQWPYMHYQGYNLRYQGYNMHYKSASFMRYTYLSGSVITYKGARAINQ